jgi:hypothetical protein
MQINTPPEGKLDELFKLFTRPDTKYVGIKLPWNKQLKWITPDAYYAFRASLIATLEPKEETDG